MKRFFSVLILGFSLFVLGFSQPALADGNPEAGGKIFKAICAACHLGGGNVVMPAKNLKKDALEAYGMLDLEKIKTQVRNGKGAMPAFGSRLTEQQIADVASYVLQQAEKGW